MTASAGGPLQQALRTLHIRLIHNPHNGVVYRDKGDGQCLGCFPAADNKHQFVRAGLRLLGTTPLDSVWFPNGTSQVRIELPGYRTVRLAGSAMGAPFFRKLWSGAYQTTSPSLSALMSVRTSSRRIARLVWTARRECRNSPMTLSGHEMKLRRRIMPRTNF